MPVSRAGARAAAESQNLLYHTAEKHTKPVEEHCSALCQLVSISAYAFGKMINCVCDDQSHHGASKIKLNSSNENCQKVINEWIKS